MNDVYLRRVRDPNPLLEAIARGMLDQLEESQAQGLPVTFDTLCRTAREFGVPLDYVLDERERRVREGQLTVEPRT